MRDKRFKLKRNGGELTDEQHKLLMDWAIKCVRHILSLYTQIDDTVDYALNIAEKWEKGKASVGECRSASINCVKRARTEKNQSNIALLRAAGQAVAVAHMSDHSLGTALYSLKAIKLSRKSVEDEQKWQYSILSEGIRTIVLENIEHKKIKNVKK